MSTPTKTSALSPPRGKRLSSLHRLAGILVVVPVLLLVATGVPLQFTEQLQLSQTAVRIDWLHSNYGIVAPQTAIVSEGVMQLEDLLILDAREVDTRFMQAGALVGSVTFERVTIVAMKNALAIVPLDSAIQIEVVRPPQPILRFGVSAADALVIHTDTGQFVSHDLAATWEPTAIPNAEWRTRERVQTDLPTQSSYRASQLNWERVLQDLHSGRLFGRIGEWIMNFASFALVVLALTGLTMWIWPRSKP
jgi:hypothetical protein